MTTPNADKNEKKLDHSFFADRNVKWYSHSRNNNAVSLKTKCAVAVQSNHSTLEHLAQRNENYVLHQNQYTNVYSSFIRNIPKLEKGYMSSMGKWLTNCGTSIQWNAIQQ